MFEGHNNIILNTVSVIFSYFETELNSISNRFSDQGNSYKIDVLRTFEIIFEDLNFIMNYGRDKKFKKIWSSAPLECLAGLASCTNLRDHMLDLYKLLDKGKINISIEYINVGKDKDDNIHMHMHNIEKYIDGIFNYTLEI